MQDIAVSRWLSPLMAFCLSFIIIATLAPVTGIQVERQMDFWLLWLGTMLILALPLCYLEIALAKRSKTTALQALSGLTRDADTSQRWRIVGWLAVVFIPFMAGGMLNSSAVLLEQFTAQGVQLPILLAGVSVAAFLLSFLSRQLLVLAGVVAVIAAVVLSKIMGTPVQAWKLTPVEFSEWGNATVLALVASGLGMGLYWQSTLAQLSQQDQATKTVLPIWIAQLLAVVVFSFFAANAQIPVIVLTVAVVMTAAFLLQMAREQLQQRQLSIIVQWLILLAAVLVWFIPLASSFFYTLIMLWGLIICLIYAIFVGWIMKISHLRKAMNFSSEAFYNIWRIMVRIVLPLAIVAAIIAVAGQLIG
jgi:SNF family Na+-dependent transporter